jgi:hypothetical protein
MFPSWFHILSAASLLLGAACALLLSIQGREATIAKVGPDDQHRAEQCADRPDDVHHRHVLGIQVIRHPQHMTVMNIVWPVSALFGTVLIVWAYFRYGQERQPLGGDIAQHAAAAAVKGSLADHDGERRLGKDVRGLDARFRVRLRARDRVSVLRHRADARPLAHASHSAATSPSMQPLPQ